MLQSTSISSTTLLDPTSSNSTQINICYITSKNKRIILTINYDTHSNHYIAEFTFDGIKYQPTEVSFVNNDFNQLKNDVKIEFRTGNYGYFVGASRSVRFTKLASIYLM